ncbi:hypothetical protein [Flavobacterium sp. FlaQc-48]|uniref:hypothetical protein n=1 Tax=Flavobacterium sp. FlaQc-48 TaxID=3374181 RepID=UPI00375671F9
MIFDKKTWKEFGEGFGVYDGAFGVNNRLCFVLVEDSDTGMDPIPETLFLFVRLERPIERRFFALGFDGIEFATVAASNTVPPEFVIADIGRNIYAYDYNNPSEELEDFDGAIPGYENLLAKFSKVVCVGASVYAIGFPFCVYKRSGINKWLLHSTNIPVSSDLFSGELRFRLKAETSSRFLDLAGFSEQDMYAVGRGGVVYHYEQNTWKNIAFPFNGDLNTVVCAGDGFVYITDQFCNIWQGRGSIWKKIVEQKSDFSYFDSAWFDNRLWLSNDYGMWVLDDNKIVPADKTKIKPMPKEMIEVCGRIDISPDQKQMLICGKNGAALYDSHTWELLFNRLRLE